MAVLLPAHRGPWCKQHSRPMAEHRWRCKSSRVCVLTEEQKRELDEAAKRFAETKGGK